MCFVYSSFRRGPRIFAIDSLFGRRSFDKCSLALKLAGHRRDEKVIRVRRMIASLSEPPQSTQPMIRDHHSLLDLPARPRWSNDHGCWGFLKLGPLCRSFACGLVGSVWKGSPAIDVWLARFSVSALQRDLKQEEKAPLFTTSEDSSSGSKLQ